MVDFQIQEDTRYTITVILAILMFMVISALPIIEAFKVQAAANPYGVLIILWVLMIMVRK